MSLSIIIPIRNEEENIEKITKKISELDIDLEICFIDDFSTDRSYEKVLEIQKNFGFIKVIKNKEIGLGSAINTGLDNVKNKFTCIMMCDESDSIFDLKKYYNIITNKNCDAVFGSRFYKESVVKNYPIKKLILNRIFNFFVSILFLNKFNDYTNAFKIYKTSSLKNLKPIVSESFNVFLEIPLKILSRKMRYETTPISWMGRETGVSKFKIKELQSKYLFTLLYCLLEKILIRK
jgi:dolichol-phosphate mannosyltransferase